jgi:hypothetical protein
MAGFPIDWQTPAVINYMEDLSHVENEDSWGWKYGGSLVVLNFRVL